jgi:hypothetical protein
MGQFILIAQSKIMAKTVYRKNYKSLKNVFVFVFLTPQVWIIHRCLKKAAGSDIARM